MLVRKEKEAEAKHPEELAEGRKGGVTALRFETRLRIHEEQVQREKQGGWGRWLLLALDLDPLLGHQASAKALETFDPNHLAALDSAQMPDSEHDRFHSRPTAVARACPD